MKAAASLPMEALGGIGLTPSSVQNKIPNMIVTTHVSTDDHPRRSDTLVSSAKDLGVKYLSTPSAYLVVLVLIGCIQPPETSVRLEFHPSFLSDWAIRILLDTDRAQSDWNELLATQSFSVEKGLRFLAMNSRQDLHLLSWRDGQERLASDPPRLPVLLTRGQAPPILVVDRFLFDEEPYYLVVIQSSVKALSEADLHKSKYSYVVFFEKDDPSGEPAPDMQGTVSVDRRWASLGFVPPQTSKEAVFQVRNTGSEAITLERILTNCGCVHVSPQGSVVIPPMGSQRLSISVHAGTRTSLHEPVYAMFRRSGSDANLLRLDILGWSAGAATVVPVQLNLGVVTSGTASAVFSLSEMPHDRFQVEGVAFDDQPIKHAIDVKEGATGLRTYVITCLLTVDGSSPPGEVTGAIEVATSSRWVPQHKIPVRYRVLSPIELSPPMVDFGEVRNGAVAQASVRVIHRAGRSIDCEVLETSDRIEATVNRCGDGCVVSVLAANSKHGYLSETVTLRCSWDGGEQRVVLSCHGIIFAGKE